MKRNASHLDFRTYFDDMHSKMSITNKNCGAKGEWIHQIEDGENVQDGKFCILTPLLIYLQESMVNILSYMRIILNNWNLG